MSEPDELDLDAAEFALGTLDAAERDAMTARRAREPALDQAIKAWEARLAPLSEACPEMAPPADLFERIRARVGPEAARVLALRRSVRTWRVATGLSALAACLALGFGLSAALRPRPADAYVAWLQRDAHSPAFVVSVDLAKRVMSVRAVDAPPQPGHAYELWLVDPKLGSPKSLGVVAQSGLTRPPTLAGYDPTTIEGATYAVTIEPERGSPTGAPTGPIVFTGALTPAGF